MGVSGDNKLAKFVKKAATKISPNPSLSKWGISQNLKINAAKLAINKIAAQATNTTATAIFNP